MESLGRELARSAQEWGWQGRGRAWASLGLVSG